MTPRPSPLPDPQLSGLTQGQIAHDGEENRLPARVLRALDRTDNMAPEIRACVHEYGYAIVNALLNAGVTQPAQMRNLVREIWEGARQPHQASAERKNRPSFLDKLDWILIQAESKISAVTLVRVLRDNAMVIVALEPSPAMIAASMSTVADHNLRITKTEKHRRRIRAAIEASVKDMRQQISRPEGFQPGNDGGATG